MTHPTPDHRPGSAAAPAVQLDATPSAASAAPVAAAPVPAAPAVPAHFQQFLAFDFGTKRTGCASGNRVLGGASPLRTIQAEGADARFAAVEKLIQEWQPQALVIGVPYHPDGAAHENTARARKFGVFACLFMKWMSATAPPRPWPVAPRMRMPHPPASSWSNF